MSGGNRCGVALCNTTYVKAKLAGESIMFFTFPKDPKMRKQWVLKCSRKDKLNPNTARICSKHFKEDDFEDAFKAKLMGDHPKKLLKDAIPSLNLPHSVTQKVTPKRSSKYVLQRERREILRELLTAGSVDNTAKPSCSTSATEEPVIVGSLKESLGASEEPETVGLLKERVGTSQDKMSALEMKVWELEKKNAALERTVSNNKNRLGQLSNQVKDLQSKLKDVGSFEDKVKLALQDFLSPNQVDIVLNKKSKARWSRKEYSRALTLLYFSKRSYTFVREELKYPLPGLSTLRKWCFKNLN